MDDLRFRLNTTTFHLVYKSSRRLVELDRGTKEGVDDVRVVIELLVHHEGKDAHLGSTAVVELDSGGTLEVEGTHGRGGEVGGVLAAGLLNISLAETEAQLKSTNEKHNLNDATEGDGLEGSKAGLHVGELEAGGDVATKAPASGGHLHDIIIRQLSTYNQR